MIQEVIVVEGKDDIEAVKRAVDAVVLATHGHGFGQELLDELALVQEKRGIIVFTDPDYAGGRIRSKIRQAIPNAKHAFLDQKDARRGDDVGIENAKPEAIRRALERAHATTGEPRSEFSKEDMIDFGLEAVPKSKERRILLCDILGIGYCNAKQLLARLNAFDITRDEFEKAMVAVMREIDVAVQDDRDEGERKESTQINTTIEHEEEDSL